MTDPLAVMLDALNVTDTHARTSEDIFIGHSEWMPTGRIFGGQVLAQSLVAAQRTIDDDRPVHSLHGYFLRAGRVDLPITFAVDHIHDGRSFATRRTQAYQEGQPIFSMIASFQTPDTGLEHQATMPKDIPQPEDLESAIKVLRDIAHEESREWALSRPFELRHVGTPVYLSIEGEHVPHQSVWFKTVSPMPDDLKMHTAALAYASDYTVLEPIFRRHGLASTASGMRIASLDHAMWFHREARVDEWLLYVQESPNARGGRGLATAQVYTRDGLLVATVAQEGMVRVPAEKVAELKAAELKTADLKAADNL